MSQPTATQHRVDGVPVVDPPNAAKHRIDHLVAQVQNHAAQAAAHHSQAATHLLKAEEHAAQLELDYLSLAHRINLMDQLREAHKHHLEVGKILRLLAPLKAVLEAHLALK